MNACPIIQSIFTFFSALINSNAFWGFISTLMGGFLAIWGAYFSKKIDQQKKSYSTLVGIQLTIKQLYVSRFEALIISDFYEQMNNNHGGKNPLHLEEAKRWMYKSENMVNNISNIDRELRECFATAVCNFSLKTEEKVLFENLVNHQIPKIGTNPKSCTSDTALEQWKSNTVKTLQDEVDEIFDNAFKNTIEMLRKKL